MKNLTILVALAALCIVGCSSDTSANNAATPTSSTSPEKPTVDGSSAGVQVAYDLGSKKIGDKGVCVICNKKEGTTAEEEVKQTLDYEGKTYLFCNEAEKADFISDPTKYVSK